MGRANAHRRGPLRFRRLPKRSTPVRINCSNYGPLLNEIHRRPSPHTQSMPALSYDLPPRDSDAVQGLVGDVIGVRHFDNCLLGAVALVKIHNLGILYHGPSANAMLPHQHRRHDRRGRKRRRPCPRARSCNRHARWHRRTRCRQFDGTMPRKCKASDSSARAPVNGYIRIS
jgi:hypothetical protein